MKAMKKVVLLLAAALLLTSFVACSGDDKSLFDEILPADKALSEAMSGDAVVYDGAVCISGREVWDEFCAEVEKGKPAEVLCATSYTIDPERMAPELYEQEKDSYPQLFFTLLKFDGEKYSYATRLSSDTEVDSQGEYAFMLHFTGDLNPQATYDHYEYYVLADDPNVTWEKIEHSIFSSRSGDFIHHKTVFTNMYD